MRLGLRERRGELLGWGWRVNTVTGTRIFPEVRRNWGAVREGIKGLIFLCKTHRRAGVKIPAWQGC